MSATPEDRARADRLLAGFEAQRDDGTYVFADRDVRHALPWLTLHGSGFRYTPSEWSEALQRAMARFAEAADIAADTSPDRVREALERYYAAQPLAPQIVAMLARFGAEEAPADEPAAS